MANRGYGPGSGQPPHSGGGPPGWYPAREQGLLRWWNGQDWTRDIMPAPGHDAPPPYAPPRPYNVGVAGSVYPVAAWRRRDRAWIIAGVIAAVVLIAIAIALVVNGSKSPDSYNAGREQGVRFGEASLTLGGKWGLSDTQIDVSCAGLSAGAQSDGVQWDGGRIDGKDVNRDDYMRGCVDGTKSALGR
jgi:hypothetical protein